MRWAGAPGVGDHSVQLPLDGIGDGAHRVAVEVDGDGTGGAVADGVVHLDRTPPSAQGLAAAATAGGGAGLSWSVADNASGAGPSHAQVNAAGDGSTAGAWETLAGASGPGPHAAQVAVGMPDGVHAWRVVAADVAGNVGATAAPDHVIVDTTPPSVELHDVPGAWVRALDLDLTATDNLQSALGLGATQIDVNAAADGSDGGEWLTRSSAVAAPGRRLVPVELGGLGDGRHVVRVVVRNGGPFGATLATERRVTVRVDRSPPTIARASFTPAPGGLTASWVADDELAGVETATVQWRDGSAWRTLASHRASDGAGSMAVERLVRPPRRAHPAAPGRGRRRQRRRAPGHGARRPGRGGQHGRRPVRAAPERADVRARDRRPAGPPRGPARARRADRHRPDGHDLRPPPGRPRPCHRRRRDPRARPPRRRGGPDADPPGRALPARRAPDGRWPPCHRGPGRARAPAVARRAGGRRSRCGPG